MDNETSVQTGKTHKSLFGKNGLKQLVSQKRVRFQDGEFDLDLSYICPNIVAMGLPAKGMDAMFRNNEQDVASMLNRFHPQSYMIYNLAQKKYDYSLFENRVQDLGWKDHHAPGLELLFQNVNSMCEFLKQDMKNVVCVHCKAGKGRTGTSIAALLVYCGLYRTPEEALKYFSYRRANTIDPKGGVTIPSQKRYIKYFANILSGAQTPNRNKYKITSISLTGVPMYDKKNGSKLVCHVMQDTITEIYNGKKEVVKLEPVVSTSGVFQHADLRNTELDGDIMLRFAQTSSGLSFLREDDVKFRISFNTHMIEGDEIYWVFYKHDLDDAYKDDDVPSQFKLEIRMTKCGESSPLGNGVLTEWQKALKNRHLYQNLFTKMSYQASTVYDPANNIGDTMDDLPNFLSQPQQVINGVIVENANNSSSFASMETWEQQQEERFLQEQANMHLQSMGLNSPKPPVSPTSGAYSTFVPNPLSPRMSSGPTGYNSQGVSCPSLPRRAKPSLQQWEQLFQQHMSNSQQPVALLATMLQPVTTYQQPTANVLVLGRTTSSSLPPAIPPIPPTPTNNQSQFGAAGNASMSHNPLYNQMNNVPTYSAYSAGYDTVAPNNTSTGNQPGFQSTYQPQTSLYAQPSGYDIPVANNNGGQQPPAAAQPSGYSSFYGSNNPYTSAQYQQFNQPSVKRAAPPPPQQQSTYQPYGQ